MKSALLADSYSVPFSNLSAKLRGPLHDVAVHTALIRNQNFSFEKGRLLGEAKRFFRSMGSGK